MTSRYLESLELRRYFFTLVMLPSPYADADPSTPQILDIAGTGGNDRLVIAESEGIPHVWLNGIDRGELLLPTSSGAPTVRINTARGNDVISVETGKLSKLLVIYAGGGDDAIFGSIGAERIVGGDGNDVIVGGDGRDTIYGEGGDDSIRGAGGSDLIDGGDGFDTLRGDAGHDNIAGGASRDRIRGSDGNDRIEGGGGNDLLGGEEGLDRIDGGTGDDVVAGGGGNDTLVGGRGNDSLTGETGDDDCSGGGGVDNVSGGAGRDYFHTTPAHGGTLDSDDELTDTATAPTAVSATSVLTGLVTIHWQYPADAEAADEFELEQSEDSGATWTLLSHHQGKDRSAGHFLGDARTHLFRVSARGDSQRSEYAVSEPLVIPALGALNLTSSPLFTGGLAVSWVDYSSSEEGFELYMRKGTAGAFANVATIAAQPESGEVVTHDLPDLAADTEFSFFVRTLHQSTHVDSAVYSATTLPARIDLGEQAVEAASDQPFTLELKVTGLNPSTLHWEIDWGDYSPLLTIEAGAKPADLVVTHIFRAREFRRGYVIRVTATGNGFADNETKLVMVDPLEGTEYVPG